METACEWRNIHYETLRATYTNSMTKGCEVFLWVVSFCAGSDGWQGGTKRYGRKDHYIIPQTGRNDAPFSYKYSLLSGVFQYAAQKLRCTVKI